MTIDTSGSNPSDPTQTAASYTGLDDPWTESQPSDDRQTDVTPLPIADLTPDSYESSNDELPDLAETPTAQPSTSSYPDPDRERLNAALGWEEKIAIGVAITALGTVALLSAGRQFLKPNPPEPTSASSQLSTPTTNAPGSPAPIGQSPASSLSVKTSPTANPAQPSTDKSAGSTSPKPDQNQPSPSPQGGAPVAVPFNTGQVPKPEPDATPLLPPRRPPPVNPPPPPTQLHPQPALRLAPPHQHRRANPRPKRVKHPPPPLALLQPVQRHSRMFRVKIGLPPLSRLWCNNSS